MQANMMSSEYDEISDMHKKVVRVSLSSADHEGLHLHVCNTCEC